MIHGHEHVRARARLVVRLIAVSALVPAAIMLVTPAAFAAISSPAAPAVAAAIKAAGTVTTGASWVSAPATGTPSGVSDAPLAGFPTEGSTFAILTNGDVNSADDAPPSTHTGTTTNLHGANVRGDTDFDVSVLKIDFTVGERMNCVRFDFRFLSEEYPEFLKSTYNDAFIAEVDQSDWTTSGSAITAPHNIAFDPSNKPISINAVGDTSMTPGPSDTTYDGATPILSAGQEVAPGAHSLYLSIFDQGDHLADSAVFVDNLVVGFAPDPSVQCKKGAAPKKAAVTLAPPTASKPVGGSHTVNATVKDVDGDAVSGGDILFTVTGANTATGKATTNASGVASFTYSGTAKGDDTITGCYDVDKNGTCDTGEPLASVNATWTPPGSTATPSPSSSASPAPGYGGLPVTGSPVGLIAGVGAGAVLLGLGGYILIRRRRVRFVAE